MAAPSVLFASSTKHFKPDEFVKQILNVSELVPSCCIRENVCSYNWHIDTKYYTTDVHLCTVQERTIGDQEFAESVEAFVIHFDPKQIESFQLVKSWMPYLEQIEPEIQILVCENCSEDDAVSRLTAQMWCIENSFELVELNPLNDDDNDVDVEDDFVETTGIKRIIQALHAHSWPNLKLKENPDICSPYFKQLMQEEANKITKNENETSNETFCEGNKNTFSSNSAKDETDAEIDWEGCEFQSAKTDNSTQSQNEKDNSVKSQNETDDSSLEKNDSSVEECVCGDNDRMKDVTQNTDDKTKPVEKTSTTAEERIDSLLPTDDLSLFAALGNEDLGNESFEELFHQLSTMKETASKLLPDERKVYAEKIAIKFWKAIGGDEDEIAGLSEDDLEPS